MKNIEDLKRDDFFKRKSTSKKVYLKGNYSQNTKRYENPNYYNINDFCSLKKGFKVFTDFDF